MVNIERDDFSWNRHCEERSDAAIHLPSVELDCRASLAMTAEVQLNVITP
jgi:hypothetical protein